MASPKTSRQRPGQRVDGGGARAGLTARRNDQWLYEHAGREQTSACFEGIWRGASTALLGRTKIRGLPCGLARHDPRPERAGPDPRPGRLAGRRREGRLFHHADGHRVENSRLASQPLEAEVKAIKEQPGRDILVLNSASIIHQRLRTDLVDDLRMAIVPSVVGGGLRLLPEGLPASTWELAETTTLAHGAIGLHYRRP